jgi:hypothetical protein
MKLIFFLFTLILSNPTWALTSQEIKASALELGLIAESGVIEYDLQGETLAALVYSYAQQVGTIEEDTEFIFDYKEVSENDEFVFGTTDANRFMNLLFSAVYYMDEESEQLYSQDERQKIKDVLKRLESAQVIYSWNPNGDSVCGTSFTTPVLIDPQAKKAYEFNFYKFEGC